MLTAALRLLLLERLGIGIHTSLARASRDAHAARSRHHLWIAEHHVRFVAIAVRVWTRFAWQLAVDLLATFNEHST